MIMTGMRPQRSARRPARNAPTAHPSSATATANPVRKASRAKSDLMASSAPLMTDESNPNRKPPRAPAIASAMTLELDAGAGAAGVVVDMAHSVAEGALRNPVNTSSRTWGTTSSVSSAASTSSRSATAAQIAPTVSEPSHAPTTAASAVPHGNLSLESGALSQGDRRRMLVARPVVALLGDVGGDGEPAREQVVRLRASRARRGSTRGARRGSRRPARRDARSGRGTSSARPGGAAVSRSRTRCGSLHAPRSRRATRRRAGRTRRPDGCRRHGSTSRRTARRTADRARSPRRRDPRTSARRARGHPRRRGTPSCRAVARRRRPTGGHRTPRITASTIPSPIMPPSRYSYDGTPCTRGVITNGGLETMWSKRSPATGSNRLPSSQVEFDAVECGVERRELQRPLGDVGGHDARRLPGSMQCLDAASGAEVEHRARGHRDHESAQRRGCPADPQHVLLRYRAAEGQLTEVRRDPPGDHAGRVDRAVRPQVEPRTHDVSRGPRAFAHDEVERLSTLGREGGQRGIQCLDADRDAEHEDPGERRQ